MLFRESTSREEIQWMLNDMLTLDLCGRYLTDRSGGSERRFVGRISRVDYNHHSSTITFQRDGVIAYENDEGWGANKLEDDPSFAFAVTEVHSVQIHAGEFRIRISGGLMCEIHRPGTNGR